MRARAGRRPRRSAALAKHFWPRGVRFVGMDIQDSPAAAEAFMRNFRISYPSLNDPGDQIALDFQSTVPPAGIPTTLVIDRTGRIAARDHRAGDLLGAAGRLITDVSAGNS